MSHPLNLTIDLYLKRMAERGELDHLRGEGKPLDLSDEAPSVLERLMMEAGAKPVVVLLYQQLVEVRGRLERAHDPADRRAVEREIADLQTRIAVEIEAYRRSG